VVGEYFIDLFVEDQVVVELKVGQHIADIHVAQVVNYLKATQMQIGLVINFGKSVEVRRAINSPREPSRS
jgi:GxxExxY protein